MALLLSKRVAIVTGANSGIGKAVALMFASRGAKVTLCGRDQERLKSVFDRAVKVSGGYKDMFLTVQGDLNDSSVRKEVVDQTVENFGRLDILVANAGVSGIRQSVVRATEETYNKIMDTNLKSVFFLIQQAVPHLEKSRGNIVNISSNASNGVFPGAMIYSLSKIALDHLTKCCALDLGSRGIRVNAVNPGFIPTRLLRQHGNKADLVNANVNEIEIIGQPLKGKLLTMEDIAEAVAFLSSDLAGCINGESIIVDNARSFHGAPNWSVQSKPVK